MSAANSSSSNTFPSSNTTSITLDGLLTGRTYLMDVQSVDDRGLTSKFSQVFECATRGDVAEPDPPRPVRPAVSATPIVTTSIVNATHALIEWTPVASGINDFGVFVAPGDATSPDKLGPETRNHQKYLDRVAELKAAIARNESDIAGIKRELGRVPATR